MKKIVLLLLLTIIFNPTTKAQDAPLWLRYPSISPDGKNIAFCYQGDIYKVAVDGGVAIALTINEAYDANPIWSHDGSKIAFSSNRYGNDDIFIVDAKGGQPQRITHYSADDIPSDFSPDDSHIIFSSTRVDDASNQMFPYRMLSELYSIPIQGGRPEQIFTVPAENAKYSADGTEIIYQDVKGYEDEFRKHHTSHITRDIWAYNTESKSYRKLTEFKGEDRNPVFKSNEEVYYLNEESGSFNIYHMNLNNPTERRQVSALDKHPIRYLTIASDGLMCFSYNGELYTLTDGNEPQKVAIAIYNDSRFQPTIHSVNGEVTGMSVSSNGKEIAFIHRGDVFVTSIETNVTKQITATSEQERHVRFSPDGKSIIYAGERNNSWNIYQTKMAREDEKYFFNSTILEETNIIASDQEEFQPEWSPDGKEIAFLENRTTIKVYNLKDKTIRTVLERNNNYSYADGDQHFTWSPDSKWLLADFLQKDQWISEIGLVNANGNEEIINLTKSGYSDYGGQWGMDGNMIYFYSDRDGMKNQASWGGQDDVYALFFNEKTYDEFRMTKEEYDLLKEEEEEEEENSEDKKDKKKKKEEEEKTVDPIVFDFENLRDRKLKLTTHSSNLNSIIVSKEGGKMYYTSRYEKNIDLWEMDLRTKEIKKLMKLGSSIREMELSKDGKYLFVVSGGGLSKIELSSKKNKSVSIQCEMTIDEMSEREYFFEHIWRQAKVKFYKEDLHGVDWDFYKKEYQRFLPYINNNRDFAIMESELLGELNASHTGCRYYNRTENGDQTAALGLFYDNSYEGDGLKIQEVMRKSPVIKEGSKIKTGVIIEKIDGKSIKFEENYYPFLNRKANKNILLTLYDPSNNKRWEERVKPISRGAEFNLRYQRWVENCKKITAELSDGRIGYVHVRGMNNYSFKEVYSNALGENYHKEALIVDTRFNGGGWLHDDLVTFLSGEKYMSIVPRGQHIGHEPMFKWTKPSAVIMSEGNYSDAHLFPAAYKLLEVGKLIGMPVAGTGTAVWWEQLHNGELVFGIPQVGMVDNKGNYMENNELQPDYEVPLTPEKVTNGEDEQIAKAIKVLLEQLK